MRPQRPSSASPYSGAPRAAAARPKSSRPPSAGPTNGNGAGKSNGPHSSTRGAGLPAAAIATRDGDVAILEEQLRSVQQRRAELDARHQRDMIAFRHRLRKLHNDNAVMRNILSAGEARRRNGDRAIGVGADGAAATVTAAECEVLQNRINLATRKLNLLVHDIEREELAAQREGEDGVNAGDVPLRKDGTPYVTGGSRSVLLRIQKLEKKLDDVLMHQSSAGVVLSGYEQHLEELREESRGYEGCTEHLDAEYANRHRDHVQLIQLYHNAQLEDRRAAEERDSFLRTLTRLRAAKERALAEKSKQVSAALREAQRREQCAADLTQQLEEEAQHLEYAEHLRMQLEQKRHLSRTLQEVVCDPGSGSPLHLGGAGGGGGGGPAISGLSAEEEERLAAYQQIFRAMMQTARVERLEDLVTAFEEEHASHDQLAQSVAEARERHRQLSEELKALRMRREAAGSGLTSGGAAAAAQGLSCASSKLHAELRTFVREEEAELNGLIAKNAAEERQLVEVARRTDMIAEKTAAYLPEIAIPATAEAALLQAGSTVGGTTLAGHLTVLKHKLLALADESVAAQDSSGATPAGAAVRSTQLIIPANNARVPLARRRSDRSVTAATPPATAGGGTAGSSPRSSLLAEDADPRALVEGSAGLLVGEAEAGATDPSTPLSSSASASSTRSSGPGVAAGASLATAMDEGGPSTAHAKAAQRRWDSHRDDPLSRSEVKQMSAAIQTQERRRRERERLLAGD